MTSLIRIITGRSRRKSQIRYFVCKVTGDRFMVAHAVNQRKFINDPQYREITDAEYWSGGKL